MDAHRHNSVTFIQRHHCQPSGRMVLQKDVILSKSRKVGIITLNRPPFNLLHRGMVNTLGRIVEKAIEDDEIHVIVITGGPKVFSEGIDLEAFSSMSVDEKRDFIESGQKVVWDIEHIPKPTIAAMAGKGLGAGLEIALACDMRLASEDSQFGHPEVTQGLIPLFGNTFRLERLIGRSKARSLIFIGEPIPAWEALEIGLLGKVTPNEVLQEEALLAASRIASQPHDMIRLAKEAMLTTDNEQVKSVLDFTMKSMVRPRVNKEE